MCGALQISLIEAWQQHDTGADESGARELEVTASGDLGHSDADRFSDPDKVCRTSGRPVVHCWRAEDSCNLDANLSIYAQDHVRSSAARCNCDNG